MKNILLSLLVVIAVIITLTTTVSAQYELAKQGDASAQYNLGLMYYNGEGVITDMHEAYIWFSIAKANGGESAADTLDEMDSAKLLTSAEIKSARREATRRLEAIEQLIK